MIEPGLIISATDSKDSMENEMFGSKTEPNSHHSYSILILCALESIRTEFGLPAQGKTPQGNMR